MAEQRVAFYDFDGTLVASNVVTRYAWFAKNHPSRLKAAWRYGKVLAGVPLWLGLDAYSRRTFNLVFYRQYKGLGEQWLRSKAYEMFEREIRPKVFQFAKARVAADKAEGYRTVMISGGLDFAVQPAVEHFEFDDVLANRLKFASEVATGEVVEPLLAEQEKVAAMRDYCNLHGFKMEEAKAYSDSASDLPMLEAVGYPAVASPDRGLREVAVERSWPIYDFKQGSSRQGP